MRDYQNAVLKMFHEILKFFKDNSQLLETNSVIKNHVELMQTYVENINKNSVIQETDFKGITLDKNKAKALLAIMTYQLSGGLRSLASDTGNNDLFNEVNTTISVIKRTNDVSAVKYVTLVIEKLTKFKTELEAYGVTAKETEELTTKLKEFKTLLLLPAQKRKEVKVATENIKELITKILTLLKDSLDNDMLQFEDSQPNIYDTYEVLREIDDSQTTHLSLYGHVLDQETKQALMYVAVTIIRFKAARELADTVKHTTKTGYYRFKSLKPDKYTIKFELENYDTLKIEFTLHQNESKKMNVELRKTE